MNVRAVIGVLLALCCVKPLKAEDVAFTGFVGLLGGLSSLDAKGKTRATNEVLIPAPPVAWHDMKVQHGHTSLEGGVELGIGAVFLDKMPIHLVGEVFWGEMRSAASYYASMYPAERDTDGHQLVKSNGARYGCVVNIGYTFDNLMPYVRLGARFKRFYIEGLSVTRGYGQSTVHKKSNYVGLSSGLGLMWKITSLVSLGIEGIADFYQSKTFTYAESQGGVTHRSSIKMAPRDFQTFVHLRFTWP